MGGGGKSAPKDNSAQLYAQQQADLARQKAEQEAKEKAQRDEEERRRAELRANMLAQRDVLGSDDEDAAVQRNVLG